MFDYTPNTPAGIGTAGVSSFEDELKKRKSDSFNFAPDLNKSNQVRAQQQVLSQQYNDMIMGKGPSVAEKQLFAGQESAMKGAAAQAGLASARGGGYGQIARGLASAGAQGAMDVNQQAAIIRAQEQQAAMSGQAGLLGQTRSADLSGAQLGQQGMVQSAQLSQQGQQARDQLRGQLMGMGLSAQAAQQQADLELEKMRLSGEGEKRGFFGSLIGGLAGAGAGFLLEGPLGVVAGAKTGSELGSNILGSNASRAARK